MIQIKNKADCCGCTACENICPKTAITMQLDEEGFLYPIVDLSLCIECGMCVKVCAFQNGYKTPENLETPLVYGVKHKDEQERLTSRSGGMFIAISDYILDKGGVVYGVGYADHFRVVHKRAVNKKERNEFKGSKYVQSDLENTFQQVKNDLKTGLWVLFSGTPCQTSGLNSFLEKTDTSNLIVCDIVCHGVPSPFIWKDYLKFIEYKYKDVVVNVNFRDKEFGWASHKESVYLKGKNQKISTYIFTALFHNDVISRPSCEICKYTNFRRPSDITLADFWGIEKVTTDFNADNKGVSLVLINTPKGKEVFNNVEHRLNYIESNANDCLQPNLQQPSKFSPQREDFWKNYQRHGFKYVSNKYGSTGLRYKFEQQLKEIKNMAKEKIGK